jgi:hypothetical protein
MPHTGFEVLEEVVYLKRLHLHTTAGAEASVPRSNPRIWSFCCASIQSPHLELLLRRRWCFHCRADSKEAAVKNEEKVHF